MGRRKQKKLNSETSEYQFDIEQALEKDEQETRYDKVITHRKKVKKRRRNRKILGLTAIVVLIVLYMVTSISNIKVIQVKSNVIHSQQEIFDQANISYGKKMIFHPGFWIERKLEKSALIESATVSKNYLDGAIYIEVEEAKVIGYFEEDKKHKVLLANGETIDMNEDQVLLISSPYIRDLDQDQLTKLAKKLGKVDIEDIALVSEIRRYETSYDKNMLELLMQDGHIVRTSFDGLVLLKDYRSILEKVNSDLRCINFLESANASFTTNCED